MRRMTVGALAKSLFATGRWEWDAAYAASYSYLHGRPTPYSRYQAQAHFERAKGNIPITPNLEIAILVAYRRVRFGS